MTEVKNIENALGSLGCRAANCPITAPGGNNRVDAMCRCFEASTENAVMRIRLQAALQAMRLKNDLIQATSRAKWSEGYNEGRRDGSDGGGLP